MRAEPEQPEVGIPGVQLAPGDHVCAFYRGLSERDEILVPYLREGLRAGDACLCVVDTTEPATVLATLTRETELRSPQASQQIQVLCSRQTYLQDGVFCRRRMMDFWDRSVTAALCGPRFTFVRAVGEMTWALRDVPGVADLVSYESELNRFLPQHPQVMLCLYDLERFSGRLVVEILKTHTKVLIGGTVVENPYYVDPAEPLSRPRSGPTPLSSWPRARPR